MENKTLEGKGETGRVKAWSRHGPRGELQRQRTLGHPQGGNWVQTKAPPDQGSLEWLLSWLEPPPLCMTWGVFASGAGGHTGEGPGGLALWKACF